MLYSIFAIDFDAFFGGLSSQNEAQNYQTKGLFATFGGVRFRGRILDGILNDFGMRKPSKTIVKHGVLELF